ncbi:MAG TPA: ATP-binding protein [Pyrinomonadaceae bacterium]|jgi:signal transduction histidine kinase/CheY-like chemotaxis protein
MNKQSFKKPYMLSILVIGLAACLYSALRLPMAQLDWHFWLLAIITITLSSRLTVQIPHVSGRITVSDTFVFLTMLLYGGEAAVLVAVAEALCSSLYFSKNDIPMSPISVFFNAGMMSCATFLAAFVLRLWFGDIVALSQGGFSATFTVAVTTMALVQYITNSGLAAVQTACRNNQPITHTWMKHYLWTSITYFAGAAAAGITAQVVGGVGFYAVILVTPIVGIVFFTYQTYLKNIEALAAAAKAEEAQRHVEELNHYIAEQERIREQYSQIEKLSALGELASGVAHDFNNTLAGILGRAQLMQMTKDPEKMEKGLHLIIKTAKDGAKTIKRIQDFARQRRDYDFAPVPVDQLLLDISEITRPRWKNHAEAASVHINLELQSRSNALVMGDESELREVLVNMVFNAVDAMPEGGRLTLSTEEVDGEVLIAVADTGTGMDDDVRPRIFDPFFTTKGRAGMGLGLAVSYGIIRRHEGTVEVESELGRGTTFRIRLPIAKGIHKPQAVGHSAQSVNLLPSQSNKIRILVVEDECPVRELLRDILENAGYQVMLAESGHEALELFQALRFDAIFTDLGLPGMSGWELARAIRARDRHIPLAAITGWGGAIGSKEQKEAAVNWVVAKPFTVEQILAIAHEVSRRQEREIEGATSVAAA